MKRTTTRGVLVSILLLAAPGTFLTEDAPMKRDQGGARLSGFHEVPPISTTGKGYFKAKLEDNNTVSYILKFSNLEGKPSVAHIHFGQALVSGGVIAFLCGEGGKPACTPDQEIIGTISPSDIVGPEDQGIAAGEFEEALRAIRTGRTYVNVHSDKFPKGEIRGQVRFHRFGFDPLDDLIEND